MTTIKRKTLAVLLILLVVTAIVPLKALAETSDTLKDDKIPANGGADSIGEDAAERENIPEIKEETQHQDIQPGPEEDHDSDTDNVEENAAGIAAKEEENLVSDAVKVKDLTVKNDTDGTADNTETAVSDGKDETSGKEKEIKESCAKLDQKEVTD